MTIGDDEELFEHAMTDEPAQAKAEAAPVDPEPQPEDAGQPRDEQKQQSEPEQPPAPEPQAQPEPAAVTPPEREQRQENRIPLAEHLAEREKRQRVEQERDQERQRREDLERRLQALERQRVEPPKEEAPIDVWANPEAFIDNRLKAVQQQAEGVTERVSRLLATEKFGAEAVSAAMGELERQMATNPGARFEHQRIMASDHPYGELVAWHKRQATMQEIGDDPAAYRQRLRGELLKDPEFVKTVIESARQQAQPAGNGSAPPNVQLPPSLNRTTGNGGQAPAQTQAMPSEAEIFQDVFSR